MIKVATLWLVNELGEVLLAQRSHKKEKDPGVWGPSVTGRLEPGEGAEDALLREVEEELNLKPSDYEPHFLIELEFSHPDGEKRHFYVYYAIIPKAKSADIRVQESEVEGIEWFPFVDIQTRMKQRPNELVASANDIWPSTFKALQNARVL